jgi:hypothetical protein
MSTWTEHLQGATILSSTHVATLIEIDSNIGHDRSMMNLVGSSIRESKFTTRQPTTLWPQGC